MSRFKYVLIILFFCSFLTVKGIAQTTSNNEWIPIREGITFGISGIALVEETQDNRVFLIVHDNKGDKEQGRFALVKLQDNRPPQYLPLHFNNPLLPIDLEALTIIPGTRNSEFLAVTSVGDVYRIKLDKIRLNQVDILQVFHLPNNSNKNNFEAFDVKKINDKLIAVWAHRGKDEEPAIIYWGIFDEENNQIQAQGSASFKVPFPTQNIRHISDLKINSQGTLYITAAMDGGNDGPFASAIYKAGVFDFIDNQLNFQLNPNLIPLVQLDNHKVEAIELLSNDHEKMILGTDDENRGSLTINLIFSLILI